MNIEKQKKEIKEDFDNFQNQFLDEQKPKNNPFGLSNHGIKMHTNILKTKKYEMNLNYSNKFNHEFKGLKNKNIFKLKSFKNIKLNNEINKK